MELKSRLARWLPALLVSLTLGLLTLGLLPLTTASASTATSGSAATSTTHHQSALPPHMPVGLKPLDLRVPGPDFALAAREQSGPLLSEKENGLMALPPEQQGFDIHGGLEAGVMAGSHGHSGHYTAGHVDLSRGNMSISLGVSEYGYHGINRYR